jgi:hypothetical protein
MSRQAGREGGREGEKEGERKCMGKDERKTVDTHTRTHTKWWCPAIKEFSKQKEMETPTGRPTTSQKLLLSSFVFKPFSFFFLLSPFFFLLLPVILCGCFSFLLLLLLPFFVSFSLQGPYRAPPLHWWY